MTEKPNFVLVPDDAPPPVVAESSQTTPTRSGGLLARLRGLASNAVAVAASGGAALAAALGHAEPPMLAAPPRRPRLVLAVDATASREPAWNAARRVTDALVETMPGGLDVALAVHGGSRVHTFTEFTDDANTLRDRAASVECVAGATRLLPILATAIKHPGIRVVVYIGDVFEEDLAAGRALADAIAVRRTRLIVLHDTADPAARRDTETFYDLAKRTGGCVVPFDAHAPDRLRDLLSAVAVYAVGGEALLRQARGNTPGAVALLAHLSKDRG
ncbi:hypothetical protein [Rhodopila sp.]|jgi:hypothetical protein|uniref:hypothetical protein n=1 Tax=Rhodopila sp. TaxID=2480087 RepID=UPI002C230D8E|nr:hypothetical protein [Rhodopila sp.]HVZ10725.1 hypothetical protein [Rhodopila sp.]